VQTCAHPPAQPEAYALSQRRQITIRVPAVPRATQAILPALASRKSLGPGTRPLTDLTWSWLGTVIGLVVHVHPPSLAFQLRWITALLCGLDSHHSNIFSFILHCQASVNPLVLWPIEKLPLGLYICTTAYRCRRSLLANWTLLIQFHAAI
jgi:hypothetical protein